MKKLELFKGMKAKADEDTENESSTYRITYLMIWAVLVLYSMRKDLDFVKQKNKLIQEQLTRQQEFNLRQEFTRQQEPPSGCVKLRRGGILKWHDKMNTRRTPIWCTSDVQQTDMTV